MLWLLHAFNVISNVACKSTILPTADTPMGKVRGHYKNSYDKQIYSAFEGIPYAAPPVGELRFRDPKSLGPWNGVLNATSLHECYQKSRSRGLVGDEDCLYLNVYVPRLQPIPNEDLDVIVHIHGGSFVVGSTQLAGPKYLMDKEVIYVNFNYRLGIFGFLSTGDDVLPGNYGLKDQVQALKWLRDNIGSFGGNPHSITITGNSAGASLVHLHYFSSLSRGLFHRGVSHGGTALSSPTIQNTPLKYARQIARAAKCPHSNTNALVHCLKASPADVLYEHIDRLNSISNFPMSFIGPVIEKASPTAFLTEYPYVLLKSGHAAKVPWMTSVSTDEGMIALRGLNNTLENLDKNWDLYLPFLLEYYNKVSKEDEPYVANKIKEYYVRGSKLTTEDVVMLYGDKLFYIPFEESLLLQGKHSPVFAYVFGYKSSFHDVSNRHLGGHFDGVTHGEDALLIYQSSTHGVSIQPDNLTHSDIMVQEVLMDMLTSFAKDGRPEYWVSIENANCVKYLFIGNATDITMRCKEQLDSFPFWKSLPIRESHET